MPNERLDVLRRQEQAARGHIGFAVPTRDILAAISRKTETHRERLAYWTQELEQARREDTRLDQEIEESAADEDTQMAYGVARTGGAFNTVVPDRAHARKSKARAKIAEHTTAIGELAQWAYAFGLKSPHGKIMLKQSDIAYFDIRIGVEPLPERNASF